MSHLMSLISRNGKTSWFKYIMSTSISIVSQILSEDGSYKQDLDTLKQIGADRVLIGFVY